MNFHEQITDELEKLKAQNEIDRQEIERLKKVLTEISEENYDDGDDKGDLMAIIDELKRFDRWGWCILIGLCSAVAIVTAATIIIGHALD